MGSTVPGRQTTSGVLLIRPAGFGFNAETAASNALQQRPGTEHSDSTALAGASAAALAEFDALHAALRSEGIDVCVAADQSPPLRPDAVFPNNWLSFHDDGTVVLYPMLAPNRRLERRADIVTQVCAELGFNERRRIDLSHHEAQDQFLEGTGSLVLDHVQRVAYAGRSPRTSEALMREWCRLMDYEACVFDATDAAGQAYYHTNVMLWIGTRVAAVCAESIGSADRAYIAERLRGSGRQLVVISRGQVAQFAGNMLELASWDEAMGDCSVLLMSHSARESLDEAQWRQLSGAVDAVLAVPVPTIERVGGGSVRCMVAEVPAIVAGGTADGAKSIRR
jgi:hypothetical protein